MYRPGKNILPTTKKSELVNYCQHEACVITTTTAIKAKVCKVMAMRQCTTDAYDS